MKYCYTIVLMLLFFAEAKAQETLSKERKDQDKRVEKILKNWIKLFNEKKYEELYSLYSSSYQEKTPLKAFEKNMATALDMVTELKSAKFKFYKSNSYKYGFLSKKGEREMDIVFFMDQDFKFKYFVIESIGGYGDAPPMM